MQNYLSHAFAPNIREVMKFCDLGDQSLETDIRDQSLFMVVGVAPKRNWLGRQKYHTRSKLGREINERKGWENFFEKMFFISNLVFDNFLIIKVPHQGYQWACPHYHCQQIVVA